MGVSKEQYKKGLYEVMRRQKEVLHDIISLEFSHDFTTVITDGTKNGVESSIFFNGAANDVRYEVIIHSGDFLFGFLYDRLVKMESIDDLRKFLAYTDGLNREEMADALKDYERRVCDD